MHDGTSFAKLKKREVIRVRLLCSMLLGLFLLTPVAHAQQRPGGDAGTAALFDRLASVRVELMRLGEARMVLMRQRNRLQARLDKLATEIDRIKSAKSGNELLPDFGLQNRLRSSQSLSQDISSLNRELDELKRLEKDKLKNMDGIYTQLIARTSRQIKRLRGQQRQTLVQTLARLKLERSQLLSKLPSSGGRSKALDTTGMMASNDAEELSERADAVADEQDRLRKRLASLTRHIHQKQNERRLDRSMSDFLADQQLFGEQSHVFRYSRNAASADESKDATNSTSDDRQVGEDPAPSDYYNDLDADGAAECSGGSCGTPQEAGGAALPEAPLAPLSTDLPTGMESHPDNDNPESRETSLQQLRSQRKAVIARIKQLQMLHDSLLEKIEELKTMD
jgi:hypothetical protein